jgi:hypothetical protein
LKAEIFSKNNRFVYTPAGKGKDITFTFRDSEPPRDGTDSYVRVRPQDGEIAWSSPVWFFAKTKLNEKQHREGFREVGELCRSKDRTFSSSSLTTRGDI